MSVGYRVLKTTPAPAETSSTLGYQLSYFDTFVLGDDQVSTPATIRRGLALADTTTPVTTTTPRPACGESTTTLGYQLSYFNTFVLGDDN